MSAEGESSATPGESRKDFLEVTVTSSGKDDVNQHREALEHYGGPEMSHSKTARGFIYFLKVKSDMEPYKDIVDPVPRRYKQFALLWKNLQTDGLVIPGFEFPKPSLKAHFSKGVQQRRKATFQILLDAASNGPFRLTNEFKAFLGVEGSTAVRSSQADMAELEKYVSDRDEDGMAEASPELTSMDVKEGDDKQ